MVIFIIDDDVTFAHRLKESLKEAEHIDRRLYPLKVELFHNPPSFTEYWEKNKKDPLKAPHLVFLDIQMPEKNGLALYLDLLEEDSPLTPSIHFCSSVGYGYFERFFANRDLDIPLFVQKSRVFNELDRILEEFLPKENTKNKALPDKKLPPYLAKKMRARFEDGLEQIKKHYYDIGLKVESLEVLRELVTAFQQTAQQLGLESLVRNCAWLLEEAARKHPSPLKLRREIKETLMAAEKVLEELKRSHQ